jgi:glycosyltransferase involved in cell wall biosynthesis
MKFSILTACYNNRRFLPQYFESVLKQTFADLEVIFVDDCSEDGSLDFAKSFGDPRLRVLSSGTRQFCSGAYAMALSEATGDICGIVDADDAIPIVAAEKVVELYDKNPTLGYIYTQHHWCDENLNVLRRGVSGMPSKSFVDTAKRGRHGFSHWRTFKRELSQKTVIFPAGLKWAVDKQMGFALEEIAYGGYYNEPLYYYRYYTGNMSITAGADQKKTAMTMAQTYAVRRRSKRLKALPVRAVS